VIAEAAKGFRRYSTADRSSAVVETHGEFRLDSN
jgi:hypothetical protein